MMPDKLQEEFNLQVKYELESAYLYLSMAAWFDDQGLEGMARWMRAQTQEEVAHAMKLFRHVIERGGRVKLHELSEPQHDWDSPLAAFEAAYKHEQFVTGRINGMMTLSRKEDDYASQSLLQWFVDEQVEEEDTASAIVGKLKLAGDRGNGLLMLDRELGQRQFTLPPDLAGFYAQAPA